MLAILTGRLMYWLPLAKVMDGKALNKVVPMSVRREPTRERAAGSLARHSEGNHHVVVDNHCLLAAYWGQLPQC